MPKLQTVESWKAVDSWAALSDTTGLEHLVAAMIASPCLKSDKVRSKHKIFRARWSTVRNQVAACHVAVRMLYVHRETVQVVLRLEKCLLALMTGFAGRTSFEMQLGVQTVV